MIIIIWTKYIHPHQVRIHELNDKLEKTSQELSSVQVKPLPLYITLSLLDGM